VHWATALLVWVGASWMPLAAANHALATDDASAVDDTLAVDDAPAAQPGNAPVRRSDPAKLRAWLDLWQENIVNDARNRYCDKAMGEDIGWLMAPFMDGFYYGYMATQDTKWVDMEFDWAEAWIERAVTEPDDYPGWPAKGAAGTEVDRLQAVTADSLLGEAMAMRPLVLMSGKLLEDPALKARYGAQAEKHLRLSERLFEKWDKRNAWRETKDGGMITVVHAFGLTPDGAKWTAEYDKRTEPDGGFSHPNNKANHVARWLLAMHDVTRKPLYEERAEKRFRLMKSRMKPKDDGTYEIWDYWRPAGPWDYKADGSPKHWIGVHPNGGYYSVDTTGIVDAYEHGIVFTKADIDRLVKTAIATGRGWSAVVPYSPEVQLEFEAGLKPASWGGLTSTPWYLCFQAQLK
jgi:hypothetical protein